MDKVNLNDIKVLVTGGNGYLGRNLINRLVLMGAKVFSLDNGDDFNLLDVESHCVDIRNYEELSIIVNEIKPYYIYHLAASLDRTRDFTKTNTIFDINLTGTVNLLNALKNIQYQNFIFTSTSDVYGGKETKPPFKEDDSFIPASPYSLSKYCAETAIKTFSELYKKNYTILRLFNFVGKDMPDNFFIPQLIKKIRQNRDFDMTKGEQVRDILYIEDILQALIISLKNSAYNNVFNVCSGKGHSIKKISLEIKKSLNSKTKLNFGSLPYRDNEIWKMVGDNIKIKDKLNFKVNYKLETILDKLKS